MNDTLASYKAQVRSIIEDHRVYPPAALESRVEGTVRIGFTLNRP